MLQVSPAYGRSMETAESDWFGGKDFILQDPHSRWFGKPCSIRDFPTGPVRIVTGEESIVVHSEQDSTITDISEALDKLALIVHSEPESTITVIPRRLTIQEVLDRDFPEGYDDPGLLDSVVPALCEDGCEVEPDGSCPHGHPSIVEAILGA